MHLIEIAYRLATEPAFAGHLQESLGQVSLAELQAMGLHELAAVKSFILTTPGLANLVSGFEGPVPYNTWWYP